MEVVCVCVYVCVGDLVHACGSGGVWLGVLSFSHGLCLEVCR